MSLRKELAKESKRILQLLAKPKNELTIHDRLELQRYMEDDNSKSEFIKKRIQ